jgi:hypothetical protein
LVHHFEVLVIRPSSVLAPQEPDLVWIDGFQVINVMHLPLPVAELLHVVCVAAECEDSAKSEVVLADVEVDLIVGEEDGNFGVNIFGFVEDVVQCLFD